MNVSEFQPLRDNVLVDILPREDTTLGGIVLPGNRKLPPASLGKVLRAGPGLVDEAGVVRSAGVRVGDVVAYPTFFGFELYLEGKSYRVLAERELLGVFGPEPATASVPLRPLKRMTVAIDETESAA